MAQGQLQVVPASHVLVPPVLQLYGQPPLPHAMLHFEFPVQAAVQPLGQLMLQDVSPLHESVEPAPTVTLASAPPFIVMLLSAPASTTHAVLPAHDETQSAAQLSMQVEPPEQLCVQPVPHVVVQVLLLLHP